MFVNYTKLSSFLLASVGYIALKNKMIVFSAVATREK